MPRQISGLVVAVLVVVLSSVGLLFFSSSVSAQSLCTGPGPDCECIRFDANGACTRWGSNADNPSFQFSPVHEINEHVQAEEAYLESDGEDQSINVTSTKVFDSMASELVLKLAGGEPVKGPNNEITYSPGMIGTMNNYIAFMYGNPAASSETYVADLLDSVGIAQPAYAQGLGFASLDPILELWKTFRNIAYFFFVIVMLVIGFMIMFQQKVGQTAVTAQQAIPHVVVALIAVTFSYAIAGLLIDLMYLLMFLLVGLFGESQDLVTQNIFQIGLNTLTDGTLGTVHVAMQQFIDGLLADSFLGGLGDTIGWIGGLAFAVVFAIAMAIGIFRLFFALLRTYLDIIITIAAAPLTLMLGAIPGRNTFGPWVKNLFGNLAIFPVVLLVLIVFQKIKGNFDATNSGGFLAPFLIGQGNGQAIATMIGMGFILILPNVVDQAKKAFGVSGGVFEVFGQAMQEAVKRGWEGGELVPGLGFTNTKNIPMFGSGKDFTRKLGIGAAGTAGAAYGGLWEGPRRMARGQADITPYSQASTRMVSFARWAGSKMGDKQIKQSDKSGSGNK